MYVRPKELNGWPSINGSFVQTPILQKWVDMKLSRNILVFKYSLHCIYSIPCFSFYSMSSSHCTIWSWEWPCVYVHLCAMYYMSWVLNLYIVLIALHHMLCILFLERSLNTFLTNMSSRRVGHLYGGSQSQFAFGHGQDRVNTLAKWYWIRKESRTK